MADEKKKNGCDCEHHEHDHECDCGCDMEEDLIMLEDEDGNEIPFYFIGSIEHEGKEYACLQEASDSDEPEIEIFEIEDVEGEEDCFNLLPIEDDLYEVLFNRLQEEIASGDGCDDPDCDCHHHDD